MCCTKCVAQCVLSDVCCVLRVACCGIFAFLFENKRREIGSAAATCSSERRGGKKRGGQKRNGKPRALSVVVVVVVVVEVVWLW